jgi:hypothetical protein
MFKKLVPVTKQRHQNITLSPVCDYSFANKLHSAPLGITEFPVACVHLPIVFLKEQDKMFPHLFMGIKPGQNLCVDEKGSWIGGYMPLAVKRYPFSFVRSDDKLILCIDEGCGLFSERTGETLFDINGKQSPKLDRAVDLLQKYQAGLAQAEKFCGVLNEFDLFSPLKIQVERKDLKPLVLEGLFYINERKLRELSDDKYLQLRHQEMIQFIYYHLLSLQNMNLLQVRNRTLTRKTFSDEGASIPDSFDFGG